jgi:hypothetical protein
MIEVQKRSWIGWLDLEQKLAQLPRQLQGSTSSECHT